MKTYNARENFAENHFRNILSLFHVLPSPQVKRFAIITYKHGIYELAYEMLSDLRCRILGNLEISGKCINPIE